MMSQSPLLQPSVKELISTSSLLYNDAWRFGEDKYWQPAPYIPTWWKAPRVEPSGDLGWLPLLTVETPDFEVYKQDLDAFIAQMRARAVYRELTQGDTPEYRIDSWVAGTDVDPSLLSVHPGKIVKWDRVGE